MRHLKSNKKLGMSTSPRLALLKGLVRSLIIHKKIKTTITRAKEAQKIAEKVITLSKKDSVVARRHVLKIIPHKDVLNILFKSLGEKYRDRNGGYTRIIPLCTRKGDGAKISILELVE